MQPVSMDRMNEMESHCGTDVDVLLFRISSLADVDKMAGQIEDFADCYGFPVGEFSSFVRAKAFAKIRSVSVCETPVLSVMAQQIGLDRQKFYEWLCEEAQSHVTEWHDYIEDLKQDAGDAMDGE